MEVNMITFSPDFFFNNLVQIWKRIFGCKKIKI